MCTKWATANKVAYGQIFLPNYISWGTHLQQTDLRHRLLTPEQCYIPFYIIAVEEPQTHWQWFKYQIVISVPEHKDWVFRGQLPTCNVHIRHSAVILLAFTALIQMGDQSMGDRVHLKHLRFSIFTVFCACLEVWSLNIILQWLNYKL